MLKLHWLEIILRCIPEMLLLIWGIYELAKKSINIKVYILSSIIMGIATFFVRMLPIYFGLHTFIMVILIICVVAIIGIPIINAICGGFLMTSILYLSEYLNIAILNLFNINISIEFLNPIIKCIFGIPSLIITYLFIITIRYFMKVKIENISY